MKQTLYLAPKTRIEEAYGRLGSFISPPPGPHQHKARRILPTRSFWRVWKCEMVRPIMGSLQLCVLLHGLLQDGKRNGGVTAGCGGAHERRCARQGCARQAELSLRYRLLLQPKALIMMWNN